MYYKIRDNILFRQYDKYGYITDNSMFGYCTYNDSDKFPGEQYVSESGSVMLSMLSKTPQHINTIVEMLMNVFVDVEYEELKKDVIEFYDLFFEAGFLNRGKTITECNANSNTKSNKITNMESISTALISSDFSQDIFSQNDSIRSLHIEIANECNERCIHCYIPHKFKTKMIDPDLFYKIICEGREMNIINVTLSGGEPLLHKDFIMFLKKCHELDLSVNVLSNLTLLTDEMITEMQRNPLLSVQTSIYSMDPLIHDSITKVKGSFEKTKNALLKLKKAGISLQISCPVMKQNKDTFYDVILFGEENNIAVTVDYVIFASYDHTNYNLANRLSLKEIEQVFDKQVSDEYINSLYVLAKEKNKLTGQDRVCTICQYYICVSADGKAFPCVGWQSNIIGDLQKETLKEIYENSEKIKYLIQVKRKDFPKCVDCYDRGYCTVCMMSNSNENKDGDPFLINDYHCKVAAMIHRKVDSYLNTK